LSTHVVPPLDVWQFGPVGESEKFCGAPPFTITTACAVFGEMYCGVRLRVWIPRDGIVSVSRAVDVDAAFAASGAGAGCEFPLLQATTSINPTTGTSPRINPRAMRLLEEKDKRTRGFLHFHP
jgi:hypothetical protein